MSTLKTTEHGVPIDETFAWPASEEQLQRAATAHMGWRLEGSGASERRRSSLTFRRHCAASKRTAIRSKTAAPGRPLDASAGAVYELRFAADSLPPLDEPGFWSVTMYRTSDSYLVPNTLGRYSTRASRPGFTRDADGSATVVLATELPERVPEANWLPAPADEPFQIGLRLYYPATPIRDGSWFPPPVRRRADNRD